VRAAGAALHAPPSPVHGPEPRAASALAAVDVRAAGAALHAPPSPVHGPEPRAASPLAAVDVREAGAALHVPPSWLDAANTEEECVMALSQM
jgi:hypothetical protein